ncbi:MAG: hypothetical protein ACXW3U_00655, partial [Rhodoplanes sp.]
MSNPELTHERLGGDGRRSTRLTGLTRQQRQKSVDLRLGRALRIHRASVPIRYRDGKPGAPDDDGSAAIGDAELAEMVDDARPVLFVRDRGGPAANSDRCNGRFDGGGALVAELPTDKPKRALGERSHHLASVGGRVIYEFIDDKVAVRAD